MTPDNLHDVLYFLNARSIERGRELERDAAYARHLPGRPGVILAIPSVRFQDIWLTNGE